MTQKKRNHLHWTSLLLCLFALNLSHGLSNESITTTESTPSRSTVKPLPIAIRAPEPDDAEAKVIISSKSLLKEQDENQKNVKKEESCDSLADKFLSLRNLNTIQIPRMGNITWGNEELSATKCFSEFVIFAQDEKTKTKNLLCPSYKVHRRGDSKFSCYANFTVNSCGHNMVISMEAWTTSSQLYEPFLNVGINCSLEINSTTHLFPAPNPVFEILGTNDTDGTKDSSPKFSAIIQNSSISCRWSKWSSWSHCSVSCGNSPGRRSRSRSQNGSRLCSGTENESKKCIVNRCAQDCVWSEWSDWSPCSVSCGTSGRSSRKRKVLLPHLYGGKPCIGDDLETKRCSGADCPVDGGWSQWSHWGYCQSKCGVGNRTRTRACDNPPPENGGRPCEENNSNVRDELIRHPRIAEKSEDLPIQTQEEVQSCKLKDCDPIDGRWSKWSRWSTCSVNCGRGKIIRTRACNSPTPAHGGQKCYGQPTQTRPCFLRKCAEDNDNDSFRGIHTVSTTPKNFFVTTTSPNYRSNLISSRLTHFGSRDESTSSDKGQGPIPHSVDITSVLFQRLGGSCLDKPPYVHGFIGPFIKEGITINRPDRYLRVGEIAYYMCNHGKVIDPISNQRGFFVACRESNGYLVKMYRRKDSDPEWPICKDPRYCLDPAPKYQGYTPPIPRRHALVNTQIKYHCIKRPNVTYSLSCFPDGRYKLPNEVPLNTCEQNYNPPGSSSQTPALSSQSTRNGNILRFMTANTVSPSYEGYLLSLDDASDNEDKDSVLNQTFGWIQSPGYPGVTAANYSQFKFTVLTHGYYVRIGIEDAEVQYDQMDLDIDFKDQQKQLRKGESYIIKRQFVITPAYGVFKFRITFQFIAP
ncbi:unnamed protein product [Lepeophtheirus salmonis]|uniref:(salmon louse) hypothetical protein n=1 Tax=Lepeophtheirus salmonis TaxID=72036 RepID=A0A7R8H1T2_LEPSM|nr:unnamed protein product [Lepeophtheirus salmonis]CAF2799419.1 unnamed protein product [Lepeophtheirus salmonis]